MSVFDMVRQLILRGTVKSTDATQDRQEMFVDTLADDGDDAQHMQPYGLRANVPAGAQVIVLKVAGCDDDLAVIVADNGDGPTDLAAGEVAVYSKHGQEIRLKTDGSILLKPKAGATVDIGDGLNIQEMVLAQELIDAIDAAWTAATPGGMDGGLALKNSWVSAWNGLKNTIKSTKGRLE